MAGHDLKQRGAALLRLCEARGFSSPRELARRFPRINKNKLYDIVNGKRDIDPEYMKLLAHAFGMTTEELERALDSIPTLESEEDNETPPVDEAVAQLERAVSAATKEAIDEWMRQQRGKERKSKQEHLEDMLRRLLSRASTSAPTDYEMRYTPAGAPYNHIGHAEEIVRIAIELVNNISSNPPTDEERQQDRDIILMTWRGERDPIGAIRDVHLRTQWVSAIRGALTKGWKFKHYVQLLNHQNDHDDQEKALRGVLNALAFTGPSERYQLCLLATPESVPTSSPEPTTDYLVVPNQGIIVMHGADDADYYPYRSRDDKSMENFDQLYATVTGITAGSKPLCRLHPQLSKDRRAVIVQLEGASGHRILCMNGLPQYLVPEDVHKERYKALEAIIKEKGGTAKQAYLDFARETLHSRRQREQLLREDLANGRYRHRDICPERAILRLVREGHTSHNDADDSLNRVAVRLGARNLPVLTLEQRRSCLSALVQRLQTFVQYELVLLPDSQADISGTYCLIRDRVGVLLQFWKRQRNDEDNEDIGPRVYTAMHIDNPTVIHAFADNPLLQQYDRGLDPDNKHTVIAFLEKQIAILDRKIAMQQQQ